MNKVRIQIAGETTEFKVLKIEGNSSDMLSNHTVNFDAMLMVGHGKIEYKDQNQSRILSVGESQPITKGITHQVSCLSDALFFVVMPKITKMQFENK